MSTSLVAALLWFLSAGIAGFWFVCSTSWPSTSRFRPVTWLAATSVRLPVSLRDLTPPRPFAWSPPRAPGRGEREGPLLQRLVFHLNSNHSSWRPLGFLPPCRTPLAKTRRNALQTVVRAFFRPQTVQLVGCGLQKAVCRLRRLRMSLWRHPAERKRLNQRKMLRVRHKRRRRLHHGGAVDRFKDERPPSEQCCAPPSKKSSYWLSQKSLNDVITLFA